MTLGTTLSDTIKEEQAFSKIAAERYAKHTKGEDGLAEVEAFEGEVQSIQSALAGLIEERVPSTSVQVVIKGDAFKVFSHLSHGIIKPYDTNIKGDPLDILVRNPLYGFGARRLRAWASNEGLELTWRCRNDDSESWWTIHATPVVTRGIR